MATNPQLPCQPAAAAAALDDDNNGNEKADDNTATVRKWSAALPRSNARMMGMSLSSYPPSSLPGGRRGCCTCCIQRWSFHHPSSSPSPSCPLPFISLWTSLLLLSYLLLLLPFSSFFLTSSLSCWHNCSHCCCGTKRRQQHHHHKHTDNSTNLNTFHKSQLCLIFTFWQKRNVFLSIPSRSVRPFLDVPAKKECSSFFLNPGSCRFQGIPGIPAGMLNLAYTHPSDNVVRSTATMSSSNIPSNAIKDGQMGVYIDEMD